MNKQPFSDDLTAKDSMNGALEAQTPAYDDADRLLSLLRDLPTGADTNWGYSYDSTQNRLSDSVTVGGVVQQQQTYTVNNLDQVTRVDSGGATPAFMQEIGEQLAAENKLDFTAQNAYNEQQTALGEQSLTGTFLLEPGTDFTWDDNGNLTAATVTVAGGGQFTVNYLWNTKNELRFLGVPGLLTIEYVYDAFGRRIRIIQRDGQDAVISDRYFVWEGLNLAEERAASSGPPTRQFYPQGEVRGGVKYYYTKDHLGSVREVVDASGNIVARYDYDPFGQPTQTFGTMQFDRLYTGHLYDWTAGLYLAPFRAYNPGIGRWISREPLGLDGPNLYHYTFNDPLTSVDPTGLRSVYAPWTWGDPTPVGNSPWDWNNPQNSWEGLGEGAADGAEAFVDGVLPFIDPFKNGGYYSECDPGVGFSQSVGELVRDAELTLTGTGLITRTKAFYNSKVFGYTSKYFARQGGMWNKGAVRMGWNWKKTDGFKGPVFRIAIGKRTKVRLLERLRHIDFIF